LLIFATGNTEGLPLQNQPLNQVGKGAVRRLELKSLISVPSSQLIENIDTAAKPKNDATHIPGSANQSIRRPEDTSCGSTYIPSNSQPQVHLEVVSHTGTQLAGSNTFEPRPTNKNNTTLGGVGTYLPFKLQHDLLTTAQTLMEEACFYFAHKWAPDALTIQGWDTPEQGELTSWWDALKACKIPPYAIDFRGTGPANIFKNVRKIRNNAVHRNAVSIPIIKIMMVDAVLLISGLKDVPRTAKLRQIQRFLGSRDLDALRRTIHEPLERFEEIPNEYPGNDKAGELQTHSFKALETGSGDRVQSIPKSTLISSSGNLNGQGQDAKQVTTARAALDTVKSRQRGQHASSQSYALPVQLVVQANDAVSGAKALKSQPVIIDLTEDIVIDLTGF
jgi:hypothetical protein